MLYPCLADLNLLTKIIVPETIVIKMWFVCQWKNRSGSGEICWRTQSSAFGTNEFVFFLRVSFMCFCLNAWFRKCKRVVYDYERGEVHRCVNLQCNLIEKAVSYIFFACVSSVPTRRRLGSTMTYFGIPTWGTSLHKVQITKINSFLIHMKRFSCVSQNQINYIFVYPSWFRLFFKQC